MNKKWQNILLLLLTIIVLQSKGQYLLPEYIENVDSTQPIVYPDQFNGSYQQVDNLAARNAIPEAKRAIGMMVTYNSGSGFITARYEGSAVTDVNWTDENNWGLFTAGTEFPIVITDTIVLDGDTIYNFDYLPLSGGTMSGDINMPNTSLINGGSGNFIEFSNDEIYMSGDAFYDTYIGVNSTLNKVELVGTSTSDAITIRPVDLNFSHNTFTYDFQGTSGVGVLDFTSLTGSDYYRFPDSSGTVALTSNISTASNGLTKAVNDIKLGGELTEETTIDVSTEGLIIEGSSTDIGFFDDSFYVNQSVSNDRSSATFEAATINLNVDNSSSLDRSKLIVSSDSISLYSSGYYSSSDSISYLSLKPDQLIIDSEVSGFNNYLGGYTQIEDSLNINGSDYVTGIIGLNEVTGSVANSTTRLDTVFTDVINSNFLIIDADSISIPGAIAQFHRISALDVTVANAWQTVKFDTLISDETTYGYKFNADSTGFICTKSCDTRVQGCSHWLWTGANNATVKVYLRILIEGAEVRCLQANDTRGRQTSDTGTLPYTGTIHHEIGDEVKLQYYVTSTDMDFEGAAIFDNPVSFSINFECINSH